MVLHFVHTNEINTVVTSLHPSTRPEFGAVAEVRGAALTWTGRFPNAR